MSLNVNSSSEINMSICIHKAKCAPVLLQDQGDGEWLRQYICKYITICISWEELLKSLVFQYDL